MKNSPHKFPSKQNKTRKQKKKTREKHERSKIYVNEDPSCIEGSFWQYFLLCCFLVAIHTRSHTKYMDTFSYGMMYFHCFMNNGIMKGTQKQQNKIYNDE